jgi:hypothetical protein
VVVQETVVQKVELQEAPKQTFVASTQQVPASTSAPAEAVKKVSFNISFKNLKDLDKFLNGKTDPYAVVSLTTVGSSGKPDVA